MYRVTVLEPRQYKSTYRGVVFSDVIEMRKNKDGSKTTLIFEDGTKSIRQTRLIEKVEEI